jgi:hypothetical protein
MVTADERVRDAIRDYRRSCDRLELTVARSLARAGLRPCAERDNIAAQIERAIRAHRRADQALQRLAGRYGASTGSAGENLRRAARD